MRWEMNDAQGDRELERTKERGGGGEGEDEEGWGQLSTSVLRYKGWGFEEFTICFSLDLKLILIRLRGSVCLCIRL